MKAIDIFAMALKHLKEKALAVISDNTTVEYKLNDIQWVITVPAIWRPPAKQFMREAAVQVFSNESISFSVFANIISNQITCSVLNFVLFLGWLGIT